MKIPTPYILTLWFKSAFSSVLAKPGNFACAAVKLLLDEAYASLQKSICIPWSRELTVVAITKMYSSLCNPEIFNTTTET